MRLGKGLFLRARLLRLRVVERYISDLAIEAERVERRGKMRRGFDGDIDFFAIWSVDPEAAGVEMELATDAAGQEGVAPAIFAITDDWVADRRHMDAQLVCAAGKRLQLDP